jgi:EAL and modified HD-GYP domain-containing signal transduction protein
VNDVYIGRQPILDRTKTIFGYELLFRNGQTSKAEVVSNIKATASVMVNALNNIGIQRLIGDRKGFVNVDREILASGLIDLLPKDSTILEILETVEVTEELVDLCAKLRHVGYHFALDDFVFTEAHVPLFEVARYVKIDIMATPREALAELSHAMRKRGLSLLAEKVETQEEYDLCRNLGFDLFQGYFFAKPSLITAKTISPTQLVLLELYKLVSKEEEFNVIEGMFRKNPELNLKLLKFINSAAFYTNQKITSIRQAIALLGYKNLKKWVTLLLYSGEAEDMKASPLLERAALRGRVMELLTKRITGDGRLSDTAFITGVLSLIDVLFQMPMDKIVEELNLAPEINDALLTRTGLMGTLLSSMERLEEDKFDDIAGIFDQFKVGLEDLFLAEKTAIIEYENYTEDEA